MKENTTKQLPSEVKIEESIDVWADPELMELLFRSEENRETLIVEKREARPMATDLTEAPNEQDPEAAHQLYYGVLEPKLRNWLTFATEEAGKRIREQKCLLLKDGHFRGRDGRMGYLSRIQQAIGIIDKWEQFCAADLVPPKETRMHRLFVMFQEAVDNLPKDEAK